jgi:hypothetical protein
VQAGAVHVEHHAVVAAADAAFLDAAIFQTRAPVDAVRVKHADAAALVAERDQLLS